MKKVMLLFLLILLRLLLLQVGEAADNQIIVESTVQITFNGTGGYRPDWSPDGKKIVFDKMEGNETNFVSAIWAVNADGTNLVQLTSNTSINEYPKWSHDGKKIVFSSQRGVWLMNGDGSGLKELKKGAKPAWAGDPAWVPGDRISLVYCISDNNCDFILINPETMDERKIFSKQFYFERPTWSLNGTKIAFADNRSGNWNIFVVDADGSNERQLTDDIKDEWWPSWNPNGTKIAYHRFVQRHFGDNGTVLHDDFDIMIMNSDGSNKVRLNSEDGFNIFPAWSPDGRKIAYNKMGDIWVMILKSRQPPSQITPASKPTPGFIGTLAMVCFVAALVLRKRQI